MSRFHLIHCLLVALVSMAPLAAQTFDGKTLQEWVQDLGSDDVEIREAATETLGHIGGRATRVLIDALDAKRARARCCAAKALGMHGGAAKEAAARLGELRKDADADVRREAAIAFVRVQVVPERVPALIEGLNSDCWGVCMAAVEVLAELGPKARAAAPALARLLDKPGVLYDRVERRPGRAETLPVFRRGTAGGDLLNIRRSAAFALAAIGPVDNTPGVAVAALTRALEHRAWPVREATIVALSAFKEHARPAVPKLLVVIKKDSSWACRREAVQTVAVLVNPQGKHVDALAQCMVEALADNDGGVRNLAMEQLGKLGPKAAKAVPALTRCLSSDEESVLMTAAAALSRIGEPARAAVPKLVLAYQGLAAPDKKERQREREFGAEELAKEAILGALASLGPERRKEIPELDALLKEREKPKLTPEQQRAKEIQGAHAQLAGSSVEQKIDAIQTLRSYRVRESIPKLIPFLKAGHPKELRAAALRTLTDMDADQIVPLVRPMLDAEEPELQNMAASTLVMFEDRESLPKVITVFEEKIKTANKDELWFLGFTGLEALVPALERVMQDDKETYSRRWGAVTAIRMIGKKSSAVKLAEFIKQIDSDESIPDHERRELVADALGALTHTDPAPFQELYRKYAAADEEEIRRVAIVGLVRLRDPATKKKLIQERDYRLASSYLVDPKLQARLESTTLRLTRVNGCTLREVKNRLQKKLGIPIQITHKVDDNVLEERFSAYTGYLGYRPSAYMILNVVGGEMFSGDVGLLPIFTAGKIRLVTVAEAEEHWKRELAR